MLTASALMLVIGVGVALLAGRACPPVASVRLVAAIGAAWGASVTSLVLDRWDPNAVGMAWTVLQAVPVSVFITPRLAAPRRRT